MITAIFEFVSLRSWNFHKIVTFLPPLNAYEKFSIAAAATLILASCAPKADLLVMLKDGSSHIETVKMTRHDCCWRLRVPKEDLAGLKSIEALPEFARQGACPSGYYVNGEGLLMYAKEGRDNLRSYKSYEGALPISVYKTASQIWLGVIRGLLFDAEQIFSLKNGEG